MRRFFARWVAVDPVAEALAGCAPNGALFGPEGCRPHFCDLHPLFHTPHRLRMAGLLDAAATPPLPSLAAFAEWTRARLIIAALHRATGRSGAVDLAAVAVFARLGHVITGGEPLAPAQGPDVIDLWERCQRELPLPEVPADVTRALEAAGARATAQWLGSTLVIARPFDERRRNVTALRESLRDQLAGAPWAPLRELAALEAAGRVTDGPAGAALERVFLDRLREGPVRGSVAPYQSITLSLEPGGLLRAVVALPEHLVETPVELAEPGRRHVRWPASTVGFELPRGGRTGLRPGLLTWDPAYQCHPTVRWESTSGHVCIGASAQVVANELESRGVTDAGLLLAETLLTLRNAMLYGVLPGERYYHPYEESIPRGQVASCSAEEARRLAQERGIELVRWPG
ncbi:MAG TPA: hypothetical protein PLU22_21880 [Polyangiaceae bacterium]|nr:hypothetical protein [Polyangiaceae bacterium]